MVRFLLALLSLGSVSVSAQSVIYVNQGATGANDGASWEDAFVSLQDALTAAQGGTAEIWISSGTYLPDRGIGQTPLDRTAAFVVHGGQKLHGGFAGTEESLADRVPGGPETVLSGDLLRNDPNGMPPHPDSVHYSDNSLSLLQVDFQPGLPPTVLDRMTLRGAAGDTFPGIALRNCLLRDVRIVENMGKSAVTLQDCQSADLFVARNQALRHGSVQATGGTIKNSVFENNWGPEGGALNILPGDEDTLMVSRSRFIENRARDGGAVFAWSSASVAFISTVFQSNSASCGGGAIAVDGAVSVTAVNTVFAYNHALGECLDQVRGGGAIGVTRGAVSIVNSTFVNNRASTGGRIVELQQASAELLNSLVHHAGSSSGESEFVSVESDIRLEHIVHQEPVPAGVTVGSGEILGTPTFANLPGPDGLLGTRDDNFMLGPGSLGIDSGDNRHLPADFFDLDGDADTQESLPLDLGEAPRVQGESLAGLAVDLGAFEFPGPVVSRLEGPPSSHTPECKHGTFPNPFSDSVTVRTDSQAVLAHVFDVLGRQWPLPDGDSSGRDSITLDTSTWPPGLYAFRLTTSQGTCRAMAVRR